MHKELFKLFQGDNTCYLKSSLTGEDDERGKKGAQYQTVHESLTATHWKHHLAGKSRIGIRPEIEDECLWGCIDVDPNNYKDYSEKKYVEIIRKYKLPFVPVASKSGGLHIFVFFTELAKVDKVSKKLNEINEQYFLSNEVFPMNKAVNMPYFNSDRTMEYAFDENNTPLMVGGFLDLADKKKIKPDEFYKFQVQDYEAESEWNHYPPCVQKLIQEGWSGNNRNNYLFNVLVLEMKKNPTLAVKNLEEIGLARNSEIFSTSLPRNEVSALCKSVHKQGYQFQCPPKHAELQPICNKELCKSRRLGIGEAIPEIIDAFGNITYIQDTKNVWYEFDFKGQHVMVTPEDMKDEKSWRTRLLRYGIYWMTLPRPKSGPPPFELLLRELVVRAQENVLMKYEDTLEEEKYTFLKDFFENHIEEDDFDKLKDNYVILDSKTNECYFRKITLERFHGNKKIFKSIKEALDVLNCIRLEYHEGVKNVWKVQMPEFVEHMKIKSKQENKNKEPTEMDDDYHTGKFRT